MKDERAMYSERTPWAGLVKAILWGTIVVVCYPLLAGWDHDLPVTMRWIVCGGVVGMAGLLTWVVGGLTVHVRRDSVLVHLGSVPLLRTTIPFGDIRDTESVVYQPLREFGGWGIRGRRSRRAWTARGNRAVKLTRTDGREILIGSDHPQRLEERIRTIAGSLIQGDETH